MSYIVNLTTPAGACLTEDNWQEVGVDTALFSLDKLLIKPGLLLLKDLDGFKQFTAWHGEFILDASMITFNHNQEFKFQSPFDGSKLTITMKGVLDLCMHLQPDFVCLPKALEKGAKLSIPIKGTMPSVDSAASDASSGILYTNEGNINIEENIFEKDMRNLSENCECPACAQKLTRAYFHHLRAQTPLLSQRFLIQHNVFMFTHGLVSFV